jgi:hypothetical protein
MKTVQLHGCVIAMMGFAALNIWGCATTVSPLADQEQVTGTVVVGRILAVITGERGRRYEPEVRVVEVEERWTRERFNVEIKSKDRQFVIALPTGDYLLNRVQINEGPFMSMAELAITFSVGKGPVTYVGTWRFGVDSPRYGRMVAVSIVFEQKEKAGMLDFLHTQYPALARQPIEEMTPQPPQMVARLFEVMSYPRVEQYFRRHWW